MRELVGDNLSLINLKQLKLKYITLTVVFNQKTAKLC